MLKKRIAVVDNEKLKDMDFKKHIQSSCPINRSGKDCIYFQGTKLYIDENLCIGCGICANTAPEAIHIINLPTQLNKPPIHRYGPNAFVMYNLPIPIFGKVVGVLGKNGIGKSTALKILAGLLKPNLGIVGKESSWKELIEFYKGTEAQIYFEKLRDEKIKIAYKPQTVDLIPKTFKGIVRDLLKSVDEKKIFDEIVKKLELENFLDTEIDKISGGELQRVAIAATLMKNANFYIFDEPTSYLDIKQRLKISKIIRELANENTAVMVVEHDLIVLDYLADLVHIMYGEPGVYGICSLVKGIKEGINVYLEGYLKEENIRFRSTKIQFSTKPPTLKVEKNYLTSWDNIEKNLGNFKLKAGKGDIYKKQIVGVLGENGIGKTTFIKILAGVLEQDKGTLTKKIKVAYKPQYLETSSDELVIDLFKDVIQKYEVELVRPLELKDLFMKKINTLSGGELQRVAIAYCLSQEADLYLLDEPSAYLDVEQRLLLSKVIADMMERKESACFVVDHDLLFVDYLSDSLLVFEGKPAKYGEVKGPFEMEKGMNMFLTDIGLTFRRDPETARPRANKPGSQLDELQKKQGKLYYS